MGTYTLSGAVAGLILVAVYAVIAATRGHRPDLGHAGELLLGALAAAGGVKLLVIAFTSHELEPLGEEDLGYMVVGALGVFWVSATTLIRVFASLRTQSPPEPPGGGGSGRSS